jgi:DivIVA domain-containing protein
MSFQFELADAKKPGYQTQQVDEFIAKARLQYANFDEALLPANRIRAVEFDLVHGGYDIAAVDAAIARLEDAFAAKEIKLEIATKGEYAITDRYERIKDLLFARVERPRGQKFSRVQWIMRGYNLKQVDSLCEHIERHFVSGAPLTVAEVRSSIFKATRGGYVEGQVDAFLDRTIELLQIEANR